MKKIQNQKQTSLIQENSTGLGRLIFGVLTGWVALSVTVSAHAWSSEEGIEQSEKEAAPQEYGRPRGMAGDLTIGPSMSLLALPHPLEIGIEGKYANRFGFSLDYGFIPTLRVQSAQAQISALSIAARWFPFRGAFFVGMRAGSQNIKVSKSATVQSFDATVEATVTSSFYTPHMGWRWVWPSGFFTGLDLGWQISSGADTTIVTNVRSTAVFLATEYSTLETDAKKVGNDLGNKALPSLTLIHCGWLF